ncbi:MAG: putative ATP/GTP hydrolase [Parcubacteria group bacterium Greene0416_14]|nr:MAG: putative ATP/GTP hydrolase [Parcubacteria group bacterium Greene0416_14]TSD01011.1 MAG: putative ATP/GTP hydrolase [Parcubacteria group bacterium Greene1014_15]
MEKVAKTLEEMEKEAAKIVQDAIKKHTENSALIIGLRGDLGAGKTVFVKAAAREFGIEEVVTSPTFVIEKIYKLSRQKHAFLVHIDAYRLGSCEEMNHIGWDSIKKDPQNIIFVEWADHVEACMPETTVWVTIEHKDAFTRTLHHGNKKRGKK